MLTLASVNGQAGARCNRPCSALFVGGRSSMAPPPDEVGLACRFAANFGNPADPGGSGCGRAVACRTGPERTVRVSSGRCSGCALATGCGR